MSWPVRVSSLVVAALVCTALSGQAAAQTRYISDVLHVPLRSGASGQHRIVHGGMPSGTRLELIETTTQNGEQWAQVETPDGQSGWLRARYLIEQPTAALQLTQVEQELAEHQNRSDQLQSQVSELREENAHLQQTLDTLREDYDEVSAEAERIREISTSAIDLHEEHRQLNEAHQLLQTRADVLQAEKEQLQTNRRHHEWLTGGLLGLGGVILALILQAIGRSRSRQTEWR